MQGVIGVLLNGSLDLAALPRVPVKPTHSRHNSIQEFGDFASAMLAGSVGPSRAASSAGGAAVHHQSASAPNSPISVIQLSQVRHGTNTTMHRYLIAWLSICWYPAGTESQKLKPLHHRHVSNCSTQYVQTLPSTLHAFAAVRRLVVS